MSRSSDIRVGVSSCLLGEAVRYDGGHKRDRFVTDVLANHFEWVPVCPEFEAGLGLPRPAMRLVRDGDSVRMVEIASGNDHTKTMERYAARRVRALRSLELCGYVLKRDSPSCGMTRVKLYGTKGSPERKGTGLFAKALLEALPDLPVEEEGRLNDPRLRENFIERVFAFRRLRDLFSTRWTWSQVVAFHTAHKLQLMAHCQKDYRELGRLVAEGKRHPRAVFRDGYQKTFMAGLAQITSPGRAANVLQHAAGHLKKLLEGPARRELAELIHDYRKGLVPLVVPITMLRHHARAHDVDYLNGQTFLEPHPRELMLRNHV
jgi:uncharacterized protein YbgA (DUF1722 family)/uncharacterized protein YbbK (DUF523 family)